MCYIKIESIEHLKALFTDSSLSNGCSVGEFFVEFTSGVRSWKQIFYNEIDDMFFITNEIDDSEEIYSGEDFKKSFLNENFIKHGNLYFAWF